MKQVTISEAKTNLSQLIQQVLAGEEIIIAEESRPLVKLVALPETDKPQRRIGGIENLIEYMVNDFDEPLADFAIW